MCKVSMGRMVSFWNLSSLYEAGDKEIKMPKINFNDMSVDELKASLAEIRSSRKRRTKRAATSSRAKRNKTVKSTMSKIEKLESDGVVIDEV